MSRWTAPAAGLFLAVLACGGPAGEGAEGGGQGPAPLELPTVTVAREPVAEPIFGTGTVVADKTTEIGPLVDGVVDAIHVAEGDLVEAGQPLFTIRQVDYRLARDEALHAAQLADAEASKAERDLERTAELHAQGVASKGQLDDARTARAIAVARRDSAKAALARARQSLEDSEVLAPYGGVITRRFVDEGTRLSGTRGGGGPVVELMKVDVVEAVLTVPEMYVSRVRTGMPARVEVDGTGATYEAPVSLVNPRVDPTTRAFEVRIALANPDLALRPGLFVKAELTPPPRELLVLPRGALLGAGDARYVFREREGRAVRVPVRVRELDALRVEVLDGLAEGEAVLTGPALPRVAEGTPVRVEAIHADR